MRFFHGPRPRTGLFSLCLAMSLVGGVALSDDTVHAASLSKMMVCVGKTSGNLSGMAGPRCGPLQKKMTWVSTSPKTVVCVRMTTKQLVIPSSKKCVRGSVSVSYTHLTLPTIYSV